MTTQTTNRTQGQYYSIDDDRLASIVSVAVLTPARCIDLLIDTDWPEGDEHQAWLDTAPINEIADWLAGAS